MVDLWEEQTFTALPHLPPHSPFCPQPPLPREQDLQTGHVNRTRRGPAPLFVQGGAGRYAPHLLPHLLPHSRKNRAREWKAQGPRLLICAGGVERYTPLLQPHSRDSRTRKWSAQPSPLSHTKGAQWFPPPRLPPTPTHTRT